MKENDKFNELSTKNSELIKLIDKYKLKLESYFSRNKELSSQLSVSKDDINRLKESNESLKNELRDKDNIIKSLRDSQNSNENSIEILQNDSNSKEKIIASLREQLLKQTTEINTFKNMKPELEDEAYKLKDQVETLEVKNRIIKNERDLLQEKLEKSDSENLKYLEEINLLKNKLEDKTDLEIFKKEVSSLKFQLDNKTTESQAIESANSELKSANIELKSTNSELKSAKIELESTTIELRTEIEALKKCIVEAEAKEDVMNKKSVENDQLALLRSEIADIKSKIYKEDTGVTENIQEEAEIEQDVVEQTQHRSQPHEACEFCRVNGDDSIDNELTSLSYKHLKRTMLSLNSELNNINILIGNLTDNSPNWKKIELMNDKKRVLHEISDVSSHIKQLEYIDSFNASYKNDHFPIDENRSAIVDELLQTAF
ncbi:unnamed protein product [[Candida] boidinii]|uniref:Unnamed protein product n=1 Tax=Candida boidinii TaxID=5477 RepID=A0A9W6T599_CANBO|nr:unnamed protein product [[Candida] boidinii]GMG00310.1 unnamed protein product [[Candida] boidinii]